MAKPLKYVRILLTKIGIVWTLVSIVVSSSWFWS